jgi:Polyketide cyclase / dehydrase and lipid transport
MPVPTQSIDLTSVRDPRDNSHGLRAELDIAAPVSVVWAVLVDCDKAPQHVPGMESCKILERDGAGLWDIREHRVKLPWFPFVLHNVVRSDYEPQTRLRYQKARPDGQRLDGEWQLTPINGPLIIGKGGTHIVYVGYLTGVLPIPEPLLRAYVRQGIEAVRAESLSRARAFSRSNPSP